MKSESVPLALPQIVKMAEQIKDWQEYYAKPTNFSLKKAHYVTGTKNGFLVELCKREGIIRKSLYKIKGIHDVNKIGKYSTRSKPEIIGAYNKIFEIAQQYI